MLDKLVDDLGIRAVAIGTRRVLLTLPLRWLLASPKRPRLQLLAVFASLIEAVRRRPGNVGVSR